MESVLTLTQARATARGVTVTVSGPPDIHFVADSALIRRLLQNLVFNGIDATASGGVITLSAAVDTDFVRFSVADEGAGIPPAIMDRIFEPYFTTKDTGDNIRGLGLGLAICRKICDLHGGDIKVRSGPGLGSEFTVVLPIDPRPAPARGAESACAGVNPARCVVPQAPTVRSAMS
jgi:signal transduction histidine kinase